MSRLLNLHLSWQHREIDGHSNRFIQVSQNLIPSFSDPLRLTYRNSWNPFHPEARSDQSPDASLLFFLRVDNIWNRRQRHESTETLRKLGFHEELICPLKENSNTPSSQEEHPTLNNF